MKKPTLFSLNYTIRLAEIWVTSSEISLLSLLWEIKSLEQCVFTGNIEKVLNTKLSTIFFLIHIYKTRLPTGKRWFFLHRPKIRPNKLPLLMRINFIMYEKRIILFLLHHINPLNAELNPISYLLALLAHHFFHLSRIRVKSLTLRLPMSYMYGAPILDVSRSHTTTQHSR